MKKSVSRSKLTKPQSLKTTANMCRLNVQDIDFVALGSTCLLMIER